MQIRQRTAAFQHHNGAGLTRPTQRLFHSLGEHTLFGLAIYYWLGKLWVNF